jgi:hypothetical protein
MIVATLLAAAAVAAAPTVEQERFRWTRTVHAGEFAPILVEPDGPMFEHARVGFGDLRVLDANSRPVPWRHLPAPAPASFEPVEVLNSGRQGGQATALLDLGPRRERRDRINLEIPDRDFVGRVVVLGADRPTGPFTRLSTTGIYDVRGARRARSTTAVFPTTIHRYLLVRASDVSQISGASVSGAESRPEFVPRKPREVMTRQVGGRTVVTVDFGWRRMPVGELRVFARDRQYDRPVFVEASNRRRSWSPVTSGRLSRYAGSSPGPLLLDVRARYIRVTIENGDDPPLAGIRVEASDRSHALVLEGRHPLPYRLLYGAAGLRAPDYEFARIPFPPTQRPVEGVLGPERANEAFDLPEKPFGERHGWILSVALAGAAAAVAVAGFLAMRKRA